MTQIFGITFTCIGSLPILIWEFISFSSQHVFPNLFPISRKPKIWCKQDEY